MIFSFESGVEKILPTSFGLGLVTDVGILLSHADHDTDVTWATDDGREDGAGSVITGEAGLWEEGDKSCN